MYQNPYLETGGIPLPAMALSSCLCVRKRECLCVKPGLCVILCQLSGEVLHGSLTLVVQLNEDVVYRENLRRCSYYCLIIGFVLKIHSIRFEDVGKSFVLNIGATRGLSNTCATSAFLTPCVCLFTVL